MTDRVRTLAVVAMTIAAVAVMAGPAHASSDHLVTFSSGIVVPDGHYRLVLDSHGRGSLTMGGRRRPVVLPTTLVRQLSHQLKAAHFAVLHRRYRHVSRPVTGIDAATITYRGRTVTVAPGATAPAALDRVIGTLRGIALKYQAPPTGR